jgi:hypothetical protein
VSKVAGLSHKAIKYNYTEQTLAYALKKDEYFIKNLITTLSIRIK